jgi:hypothetical protein
MKKLTLNLDDIQVVSFATKTVARDRGTVDAHSDSGLAVTPILACGASLAESCRSCFPDVCPHEKKTTEYWNGCQG